MDYLEKSRRLTEPLMDPEGGDAVDTKATRDSAGKNESSISEDDEEEFDVLVLDVF